MACGGGGGGGERRRWMEEERRTRREGQDGILLRFPNLLFLKSLFVLEKGGGGELRGVEGPLLHTADTQGENWKKERKKGEGRKGNFFFARKGD